MRGAGFDLDSRWAFERVEVDFFNIGGGSLSPGGERVAVKSGLLFRDRLLSAQNARFAL